MVVFALLIHLLTTVASASDTEPRPIIAPNSRVSVNVTGTPSPGYYLIGSVDNDSIGVIDNAGVLILPRHTGPATNITPTPYGGLTYYHGSLGKYVMLDATLQPIDTFGIEPPYTTDFHEGYQARGRRYIVLGTEERLIDMSSLVANGRYDAVVLGAVIQEFDRYGRKTFEWKSLDHISPIEATPDVDLRNKRIDYIHVNSITEDLDRNFLVSCRNLDQVLKINRNTGAIMWRLGGTSASKSDFSIINDDNTGFHGFSHQHTPLRARNGDILLFDNGNLRPVPFSRAVAYRLDEESKTATKTWEYISNDLQISTTMGSVQELPNGNILIGWGTTPTGLIGSEVDRNGTIHAEIHSTNQLSTPYRVRKSVIGMTVSTRTIDTLGRVVFASFDSTTRIAFDVEFVRYPTPFVVEKHNYPPHNLSFAEEVPCNIIPIRWMIRGEDTSKINARVSFDCSRLLGDIDITDVDLYYREVEGDGVFSKLASDVVLGSQTRTIPTIRQGEYTLGALYCTQPTLRVPNNKSVVGSSVRMEWSEALGADGYELEVAEDPSFSNETSLYRTLYNDTTLTGFSQGGTYHWRVRVIRQPEVGPWTLPWSFTIPITSSVDRLDPTPPIQIRGTLLFIGQELDVATLDLYDVTGQLVLRTHRSNQTDVAHLQRGVYIAVVTTSSGTIHRDTIMR